MQMLCKIKKGGLINRLFYELICLRRSTYIGFDETHQKYSYPLQAR
jgi:hypothetical protein